MSIYDNYGTTMFSILPEKKKQEVLEKLHKIEKSVISPDMPDVVKVFVVNKYIVTTAIYDRVNYYLEKAGKRNELPNDDYSLYGVLCKRMGVCAGVAQAVSLILARQNIECKYVTGKTKSGGGHAWNMVKLNGNWYALDVTWNLNSYYSAKSRKADLVASKKPEFIKKGQYQYYDREMEKGIHKYFLLTDTEMRESRTWKYESYPTCGEGQYSHGKYMNELNRYEQTGKKRILRKTIWPV